ncbi:spore germination protein PC [Bacillus mesophilus]|uniref:Spore gernimation protein n=1 Tax=Bacillus mesophilus TaxID=1808955 RepID=A0A6M0Q382_9BACI|nr:spore germination protein GerPC [Bacillus mesophilus]MBM7659813.1 spore germination protein PC [Bacillus mesophilus]NEY70672.1 spore gernimation protein [Bacillus mesophilus]
MYYNQYDLTGYFQQINQYIQHQQTEITSLQKSVQALQAELKELKTKPTTNIEKIEYKFDQLKVETLEGTLNIGLNPYNTDQVEEFAVNQGAMNVPQTPQFNPQIQERIRQSIHEHLEENGYRTIQEIEQKLGIPPNESYYDFMIEDVKRQLDGRITYYIEQTPSQHWGTEERSGQATEQITQKLKYDIEQAFVAFIQHLPNEWKGEKR